MLHWGAEPWSTTATVFAELMAALAAANPSWIRSSEKPGSTSRRRKRRDAGPRRILADFLIGAHALEGGHSLLTLDDHLYRTASPHLIVLRVVAVINRIQTLSAFSN